MLHINHALATSDHICAHNARVDSFMQKYQKENSCTFSHLTSLCTKHPGLPLISITPISDDKIPGFTSQGQFVAAQSQTPSLFNLSVEEADQYVALSLPVLSLIVTPKALLLNADPAFQAKDIENIDFGQLPTPGLSLDGADFIKRFRRQDNPVLYVEHITDEYYQKYGWTNLLHANFRMNVLLNPGFIGSGRVMITPHY